MSKKARTPQQKEDGAKFHRAVVAVLENHGCPFTGHTHTKPWTAQDLQEVTKFGLTTCRRYLNAPPANFVGMHTRQSLEELVSLFVTKHNETVAAKANPENDKTLLGWQAERLQVLIDTLLSLSDPNVVTRMLSFEAKPAGTDALAKSATVSRPTESEGFDFGWPLAQPDWNALLALFHARHGRGSLERVRGMITASDPSAHVNDLLRRVNHQVETLNAALAGICAPLSEAIGAQDGVLEELDKFELRASVFVTVPHRKQSSVKLLCRVSRSRELEEAAASEMADGTVPSAAYITTNAAKFVVARATMQDGVCYSGPEAATAPGLRDQTYVPVAVSALRFNIEGAHAPAVRAVVSLDAMTFASASVKVRQRVFKKLNWGTDGALWIEKTLRGIVGVAERSLFGPVPAESMRAFIKEFSIDVDHV